MLHKQDRWQTAMNVLLAAVDGGPSMFARITIIQAINPPGSRVKRRGNGGRLDSEAANSFLVELIATRGVEFRLLTLNGD